MVIFQQWLCEIDSIRQTDSICLIVNIVSLIFVINYHNYGSDESWRSSKKSVLPAFCTSTQ